MESTESVARRALARFLVLSDAKVPQRLLAAEVRETKPGTYFSDMPYLTCLIKLKCEEQRVVSSDQSIFSKLNRSGDHFHLTWKVFSL